MHGDQGFMSSMDEEKQTSEKVARAWANEFLIAKGSRSYSLHLPSPNSTQSEPSPLCSPTGGNPESHYRTKPVEAFPVGYRELCQNCLDRLSNYL